MFAADELRTHTSNLMDDKRNDGPRSITPLLLSICTRNSVQRAFSESTCKTPFQIV